LCGDGPPDGVISGRRASSLPDNTLDARPFGAPPTPCLSAKSSAESYPQNAAIFEKFHSFSLIIWNKGKFCDSAACTSIGERGVEWEVASKREALSVKASGPVVLLLRAMARRYSWVTLHKLTLVCIRLGLRALDQRPHLLEKELRAMQVERQEHDPRKGKKKRAVRRKAAGPPRKAKPKPPGPVAQGAIPPAPRLREVLTPELLASVMSGVLGKGSIEVDLKEPDD